MEYMRLKGLSMDGNYKMSLVKRLELLLVE
jgi:hypothetical protein